MSQGNGGDIGAVYQLLLQVAETVRGHDSRFESLDRRLEGVDRQFETVNRQFETVNRGFKEVRADIAGLRQAVTAYHSSVLGHGILISELEERVRRIEQHLELPPAA
jgi:chromosome segregation ATPase